MIGCLLPVRALPSTPCLDTVRAMMDASASLALSVDISLSHAQTHAGTQYQRDPGQSLSFHKVPESASTCSSSVIVRGCEREYCAGKSATHMTSFFRHFRNKCYFHRGMFTYTAIQTFIHFRVFAVYTIWTFVTEC